MKTYKITIYSFLLLMLISYGFLYYTYKFYSPDFGGKDFYFYYPLYKDFSISNTEAPFNMRLISPFIVFLMNKINIYYFTFINYHHSNIDQKIFFNAIFINWLSVIITSQLIFNFLYNAFKNIFLSFFSALLYLFSFGTILFCINPNTDGFSILLITIAFILYKNKSSWIYLLYILLLFQREFAFVIFGFFSFFKVINTAFKENFYKIQLIVNILFFVLYYLLRKTIFLTPMYANQITESGFLYNLFFISLNLSEFVKQVFLTQNLFFIFLLLLCINGKERLQFHKNNLIMLFFFIIITFIVSRIAVANNNMGRFLHMFSPILIIELIYPELELFIKNFSQDK